jgi:hypothetical protein
MLDTSPLLTAVKFPSSVSGTFSAIRIYGTAIADTLDLSMFNSYTSTAALYLQSNSSLKYIKFPASITGTMSGLTVASTGITGTLDLSMFNSFTSSATLNLSSNSSITNVNTAASISGKFLFLSGHTNPSTFFIPPSKFASLADINNSDIQFQSNGWSAAQVDQFLVEMATLVSGESAGGDYTGRKINVAGSGGTANAAPTDGSVTGYDGITAKASLIAKGFTVTTN